MAGHGMSIGWTVAVVRIPAEVRMTQSLDLELTELFELEPGRYTLSVLPWVGTPARSNVKVNVDVEGVPFELHPKPPRPQRLQRWDEDGRLLPVEVPWLGVD